MSDQSTTDPGRARMLLAAAEKRWEEGFPLDASRMAQEAASCLRLEQSPDLYLEAQLAQARALEACGLLDEAVAAGEKACRSCEDSTVLASFGLLAHAQLAHSLMRAGRGPLARVAFRGCPDAERFPEYFELWCATGLGLGLGGEVLEALTSGRGEKRSANARALAALFRAEGNLALGRYAVASECYAEALAVRWSNSWRVAAQARMGLAGLSAVRGDFETSLHHLDQALRLLPQDAKANWIKGEVCARQALLLGGALRTPELAEAPLREAVSLAGAGGLASTLRSMAFGEALPTPHHPASQAVEALRAANLAMDLGDAGAAERLFRLARSRAESSNAHELLVDALFGLARVISSHDAPGALSSLCEAELLARDQSLEPQLALILLVRARFAYQEGKVAESIAMIQEAGWVLEKLRSALATETRRRRFGAPYYGWFEEMGALLSPTDPGRALDLFELSLRASRASGLRPLPDSVRDIKAELQLARLRGETPAHSGGPNTLKPAPERPGEVAATVLRLALESEPASMRTDAPVTCDTAARHLGAARMFLGISSGADRIHVMWAGQDFTRAKVMERQVRELRQQARHFKTWITARRDLPAADMDWRGVSGRICSELLAEPLEDARKHGVRSIAICVGHDPLWHGFPFHVLYQQGKPLFREFLIHYVPSMGGMVHADTQLRERAGTRPGVGLFLGELPESAVPRETERAASARALTRVFGKNTGWAPVSSAEALAAELAEVGVAAFLGHCLPEGTHPGLSCLMLPGGRSIAAYELSRIPMEQMRCVILAACSGMDDAPGSLDEGTGPTAALLAAGAPSVISCGWPVQESTAHKFIAAFAENLHSLDIGTAYSAAVTTLLTSQEDEPHSWGVFFLNGATGPCWSPSLSQRLRLWVENRIRRGTRLEGQP